MKGISVKQIIKLFTDFANETVEGLPNDKVGMITFFIDPNYPDFETRDDLIPLDIEENADWGDYKVLDYFPFKNEEPNPDINYEAYDIDTDDVMPYDDPRKIASLEKGAISVFVACTDKELVPGNEDIAMGDIFPLFTRDEGCMSNVISVDAEGRYEFIRPRPGVFNQKVLGLKLYNIITEEGELPSILYILSDETVEGDYSDMDMSTAIYLIQRDIQKGFS